jgi:formate hydrogenlyase subunit 6/NADH:ubiquinone oxidoreductase subunit I
VTCANTCPTHAISFPSLTYLHSLYKNREVMKQSRKELEEQRERYQIRAQQEIDR